MQDNEAIRNAVLRYDISHPVVNDARMVLWRDLGVASWPTLLVVSPRGRVIASLPGAHTHAPLFRSTLEVQARGHLLPGDSKSPDRSPTLLHVHGFEWCTASGSHGLKLS